MGEELSKYCQDKDESENKMYQSLGLKQSLLKRNQKRKAKMSSLIGNKHSIKNTKTSLLLTDGTDNSKPAILNENSINFQDLDSGINSIDRTNYQAYESQYDNHNAIMIDLNNRLSSKKISKTPQTEILLSNLK